MSGAITLLPLYALMALCGYASIANKFTDNLRSNMSCYVHPTHFVFTSVKSDEGV
jgi:hypothetical protein